MFGMNCSPFLLNATLKYHFTKYYALEPVLAQNTLEGLCVDDWTAGGENEDEVYALYKTTNACFASGGLNLRKWASNKKEVIEKNEWNPKGRQLVKKTLHQCVICKKLEGLPYKAYKRADVPAFTHVGVDFAGPLFTKTTRGTAKTYICLFTCATSRAIRLELLSDLSSEVFIRGLQRFAGRRGTPASITSDNAKTSKPGTPKILPPTKASLGTSFSRKRRGGEDIMSV